MPMESASRKSGVETTITARTGLPPSFFSVSVLQPAGLRAYKNLAKLSNVRILWDGCLQHCKRDFLSNELKDNPDAKLITGLANSLYAEEHKHRIGKDGWTADDNLK